jgi:small nuclear ribonucleoprotein (snRNP)-like protein
MGKRIERIFSDKILENSSQLLGQMLTIILKNNGTLRGHLVENDLQNLSIKQKATKPQKVAIDTILEIQIDKSADW